MGLADRPLALTLGDPAGIGPDITLLAWQARKREAIPPFVLLGDADVACRARPGAGPRRADRRARRRERSAGRLSRRPPRAAGEGRRPGGCRPSRAKPPCLRCESRSSTPWLWCGKAPRAPLSPTRSPRPCSMARASHFRGIRNISPPSPRATAKPLHPVMMLAGPQLKVVPVTIHVPLKEVPQPPDQRADPQDHRDHRRGSWPLFRHRATAPRRVGPQPACRRGRRAWPRGDRDHRPGNSGGAGQGPRRYRSASRRHAVPRGRARRVTTPRSACITTRRWCRSRRSLSRTASMSRSGCLSCEPRPITAPPSASPVPARRARAA